MVNQAEMTPQFPMHILPQHIAETIGHFSGRSWLPEQILEWFEDDKKPPLYLIVGQPGTGKSMLAAWLAGFGRAPDDPLAREALQRLRSCVVGAHFCQEGSDTIRPKILADQLARQLTTRLKGFDRALATVLGEGLVNIRVDARIDTIATGGRYTGVYINNLNLDKLLGSGAIERALIQPLRRVYEQGFNEKILLVIDSMDEAYLYKGDSNIIDVVLELAKMKLPIRILATSREDPNVLSGFRAYPRLDLKLDDPRNLKDVSDYVDRCLQRVSDPKAAACGQRIKQNAGGNFLFAHLVIQDMLKRLANNERIDLDDIPVTLSQHYYDSMRRLADPSPWRKRYARLFGLAAVAQGIGFQRSDLANFLKQSPDGVLPALQSIKPFLEGSLNDGPFHSFHKSFTDFLLEDEDNIDYKISPADPHASIVYYYWPRQKAAPPVEEWDDYARRYIVTHLAGAGHSANKDERHRMAQRIVETVSDPLLKDIRVVDTDDLADTARHLKAAIETACRDDLPAGLPLVLRAVRAYQAFYGAILQPAHIFDHAVQGGTVTAMDKLSLFTIEPRWRKAAMLAIAWLAAPVNPNNANAALGLVSTAPPFPVPLDRLKARVEHALGGPEPALVSLPNPPDRDTIDEIFAAILGDDFNLERIASYRTTTSMPYNQELFELLNAGGDETPAYQALEYGPIFVSFARKNPGMGDELFEKYLAIQGSNQYIYYRNLTLWIIMEAVLRCPEETWARPRLRELLELALTGESAPFEESTSLALLGLQAAAGDQQAVQQLEQRRSTEEGEAGELDESRRNGDTLGAHKRRLCALALAYQAIPAPDAKTHSQKLLQLAQDIPRGFAGLLYKAWLALYETLLICRWPNPLDLQGCLDEAMRCAHKINDPTFSVLATARVRTLGEEWLALFPGQPDIPVVVERFARQPLAPAFAPIHRVSYDYPLRYDKSSDALPLPGELVDANQIWSISEQLGLSVEGMIDLNEDLYPRLDEHTLVGPVVRLHDPEFIPLMAARLSAEVVAAHLPARTKQRLIQMLVPHALPNRTALDVILARLVFASGLKERKDLDALFRALPRQDQPAEDSQVFTGTRIGRI